jgi:hypothetical protein
MEFTNEELEMLLKLVEAKTVKVGNPDEFARYGTLAIRIRNHLEPPLIAEEG